MRVVELDAAYKGKRLAFKYVSRFYYRAEIVDGADAFGVRFAVTPFPGPVTKRFEGVLLEDWLESPRLFGMESGGEVVAFVETDHERWNNRLRLTNVWVAPEHRRAGVGSALMRRAVSCAEECGARG